MNAKKPPLAAWKMVTILKLKGGSGVIKISLQNDALLMKNLHKFYMKEDLPHGKLIWSKYYRNGKVPGSIMKSSFWWKGMLNLLNTYKGCSSSHRIRRQFFFGMICGMIPS
jgi:hypothetical protein